jgi:large subunit ribosomal protein L2
MGKKILVQRRGRGGQVFRAQTKQKIAPAKIIEPLFAEKESPNFTLIDLYHERGRSAPLAKFEFENTRTVMYLPAAEGIAVGDTFQISPEADIKTGNILPLYALPESTPVCCIEGAPGDGGKYCKASGTTAMVVAKSAKTVSVQLKSGVIKEYHRNCRAIVGIIAGGGRTEKPFLKAGKAFAFHKAKGKMGAYPKVSGVAMNHHVHPYGGSQHKAPKMPKTVSRNAPPGAKIGLIAARRTGRRKGKISKSAVQQ